MSLWVQALHAWMGLPFGGMKLDRHNEETVTPLAHKTDTSPMGIVPDHQPQLLAIPLPHYIVAANDEVESITTTAYQSTAA